MSRADHGTLDLCKSQKCGKKRSILVQIGYGMMRVREYDQQTYHAWTSKNIYTVVSDRASYINLCWLYILRSRKKIYAGYDF